MTGRRRGMAVAGAALIATLAAGCFGDGGTTTVSDAPVSTVTYQVDDGCGAAGVIEFLGFANGGIGVSGAEWCGLPPDAEALEASAAKTPDMGGWRLHGDAYLCAPGAGTAGADGDCTSWTTQWRLCTAAAASPGVALTCLDFQDDVVCTATLTPQS